ncbi:sensor histidine kinase [Larkinella insperata]|uniref:Sensor histidine kinase n=1 Tax=Larkinella insperata TaxID=332158 RepID=A0ABW3QKZ1_9BACT
MTQRLTSRQKWQLAIRLILLYSPLILYVNLPESARTGNTLLHILPFIVIISVMAVAMYFIWIGATDWIQRQLFHWFGSDFLLKSSWLAFFLTLFISLCLAILYSLTFHWLSKAVFAVIFSVWPSLMPQFKPSALSPEIIAFGLRVNLGFAVMIMLSAFYWTINARAYQQLKDVKLKAEQLEKEAVRAQLEALKNQVSPHFLFNSLSILTSLVHEDADLSEQFINQLSKAYRYLLEQRDQEVVPLNTEVEFIQAYTFLLKIRFENKFEVHINLPEDVLSTHQIAPLTLQLLVENVVKHNRMSIREPLGVTIYSDKNFLVVENPLQPRDPPEPSTGVGLRNITNRYSLLTHQPVWYGERQGTFVVKIPLLS